MVATHDRASGSGDGDSADVDVGRRNASNHACHDAKAGVAAVTHGHARGCGGHSASASASATASVLPRFPLPRTVGEHESRWRYCLFMLVKLLRGVGSALAQIPRCCSSPTSSKALPKFR